MTTKNPTEMDPELLHPEFDSVIQMLDHAAENYPDRTAIISNGDQINYRTYRNCVASLAALLADYEVTGERVVLMNLNSIESAVVAYAVLAAGAQLAQLNPLYTEREINPLIEELQPKLIISGADFKDRLSAAAEQTGGVKLLILGDDELDLDRWRNGPDLTLPRPFPKGGDIAHFLFTGGTTGVPKGAVHTHSSLVMTGRLLHGSWKTEVGTEIYLNVAPQSHSWGMCSTLLVPVLTSGTVVTLPKFHPQFVLEELERHEVTVFNGGPAAIYNAILSLPELIDTDLSNLHLCLGGGSIFNDETVNAWKKVTGNSIYVAYGMSEIAPMAMHRLESEPKIGTVGKTCHMTEIEIVDIETGSNVLPDGEDGEIRVRGPHMLTEYWQRPEETANTVRDGWIHTGDIGHVDDDGMLVIADRIKDMAIVGGYNVFPREIDEVLYAHPALQEAAAIGVPDAYRGEVIHAFAALMPNASADETEIIAYCQQNLAKYKVPEKIYIIDTLPKTPANKIDKQALRQIADGEG